MSYDTTQMTVAEIRTELVNLGFDVDDVASIKGKSSLVSCLLEAEEKVEYEDEEEIKQLYATTIDEEDDEPFLSIEDIAELAGDTEEMMAEVDEPDVELGDPGWTAHVLDMLQPDEKVKKNPTVDGLRRIAEVVLGDIQLFDSEVLQVPTPENGKRATVKVSVQIACLDGIARQASAVADSYPFNTDAAFSQYPVAVAETRAEGRALRKLLRLKKVIAAEEAATEYLVDPSLENDVAGRITSVQIKFLESLCRDKLDVDLVALLIKQHEGITSIRDLGHQDCLNLFQLLNTYQQTGVPSDIKGFDPNWKSVLDKGE